jgi:hypothetical protein
MARGERRKCKSCLKLFRPDPRSCDRQQYCSAPLCRGASKAASQARWLAKPENQDYFRHPLHVARVREWRTRHVDYWRKSPVPSIALQDVRMAQPIDCVDKTSNPARSPLQEIVTAQPVVLLGLIAHLVGTPLQDDIVRATRRLLRMGQDILAASEVGCQSDHARARRGSSQLELFPEHPSSTFHRRGEF